MLMIMLIHKTDNDDHSHRHHFVAIAELKNSLVGVTAKPTSVLGNAWYWCW